jgi:hypothetical protein
VILYFSKADILFGNSDIAIEDEVGEGNNDRHLGMNRAEFPKPV